MHRDPPEYTYLLTDKDLDRIESLFELLGSAIHELFYKREIPAPSDLDSETDLSEMRMHELYADIVRHQPIDPNSNHDF